MIELFVLLSGRQGKRLMKHGEPEHPIRLGCVACLVRDLRDHGVAECQLRALDRKSVV